MVQSQYCKVSSPGALFSVTISAPGSQVAFLFLATFPPWFDVLPDVFQQLLLLTQVNLGAQITRGPTRSPFCI